jgi:hypothetical protein
MLKPITTQEILITYYGDPAVGNFTHQWKLDGPFTFDTPVDFEDFKKAIQDAFEVVCDERVGVETVEARIERWEREDDLRAKFDLP